MKYQSPAFAAVFILLIASSAAAPVKRYGGSLASGPSVRAEIKEVTVITEDTTTVAPPAAPAANGNGGNNGMMAKKAKKVKPSKKGMKKTGGKKVGQPAAPAAAEPAPAAPVDGADTTEVEVVVEEEPKPKFVVFPVPAPEQAVEEDDAAAPAVVVVEDEEDDVEVTTAPATDPVIAPQPEIILPPVDAPAPAPEPTPIPDDAVCFPSFATVELESGATKRMDQLAIGDRVRTGPTSFSDVFMFTHKLENVINDFVRIHTAAGPEITLTHSHYLYLNGALAAADQARIGDSLQLSSGARTTVAAVSYTKESGLYNPQTLHGDIYVDGVRASTYTRAVPPAVAHTLLAPLRMLFRAGAGDATRGLFEAGAGPVTSML